MKISLIIPVYNDENIIEKTLEKLRLFIKEDPDEWDVLIVNDGSTDGSLQILENYKSRFYKIVSYKKNKGKGFAVKKGVEHAVGDSICFTDSDLAYSFENLKKIVLLLDKYDIVIGSRSLSTDNHENISLSRRILGKGFNKFTRYILKYDFKDTQCGLKAFRRDVAKDIFSRQTLHGFSFDTEVLYIANKNNYTIKEAIAVVSKRHHEKNSRVSLIVDPTKMFLDLLKIRLNDRIGKYE